MASNKVTVPIDLTKAVSDTADLIKLYIKIRKPLMLHGGPGIGKSAIVAQVVKELGREMIDFRASLSSSEDIKGYPYLQEADDIKYQMDSLNIELQSAMANGDAPRVESIKDHIAKLSILANEKVMKFAIANSLPRDPHSTAVLFLDEVNLAPPSTQSALYQLIHDRRIGEYILPEGVDIIAAGNRSEDRGNIFEMSKPLDNRFGHVIVKEDVDQWLEYALIKQFHPTVTSFIKANPQRLNTFDPESSSHAFATPRTVELASMLMFAVDDLTSGKAADVRKRMIKDAIGSSVGTVLAEEMSAWSELTDKLPSPKDICDGKVKKLERMDLSLRFALVSNVLYYLNTELRKHEDSHSDSFKKTDEYKNWAKLVNNYLEFTFENDEIFGAEFAAMFITTMRKVYDAKIDKVSIPAIGTLLTKYTDVFLISGQ